MTDFDFDPETHTYRIGGRVVPSVTQIIRATLPGWSAPEWYLQRGRALHHGCALDDKGILDDATVSPEIAARIRAWRKFKADSGAMIQGIEMPMFHAKLQFAGTCDRTLSFADAPMFGRLNLKAMTVCDLKSTIAPQVIPQLGLYSLLLSERGIAVGQGAAVELRTDGEYRVEWLDIHELRRAEQIGLALLTSYGFMSKHGLLK